MPIHAKTAQAKLIQIHGNQAIELEFTSGDDSRATAFYLSVHDARLFADMINVVSESANNAQIEGAEVDWSYKVLKNG